MARNLYAILGLISLFILLAGAVYVLKPKAGGESYTYNYFEFRKVNDVWYTQTQEGQNLLQVSLRHGPRELEDIPVRGDITAFKQNSFFYITFDPRPENHDPYVTMANAEISPPMVVHFAKDIQVACTVEHDACTEMGVPRIDCKSTEEAVIFINRNESGPSVAVQGSCATISGLGEELVMAADRFMYGMYGIMK